MKTTTRIAALAAAPTLALSMLGAPAQADAPEITAQDFLTGAQVGKFLPDLKKSKPEIDRIGTATFTSTCDAQKRLRPKNDRVASYATARSKHVLQISVFEMKSTADAKKVLAGSRKELACGFVDVDGGGFFDRTKAPKSGNESLGQLVRWGDEENEPARMAYYVSRQKNRVVSVLVVNGDRTPNLVKARGLARAAFKVAR